MILAILMLVIAGVIYYNTHKVPPDPLFKKETVYVEEEDFWQEDFNPIEAVEKAFAQDIEKGPPLKGFKAPNSQQQRAREKSVQRRRKRRRIAKKSRQQNRS